MCDNPSFNGAYANRGSATPELELYAGSSSLPGLDFVRLVGSPSPSLCLSMPTTPELDSRPSVSMSPSEGASSPPQEMDSSLSVDELLSGVSLTSSPEGISDMLTPSELGVWSSLSASPGDPIFVGNSSSWATSSYASSATSSSPQPETVPLMAEPQPMIRTLAERRNSVKNVLKAQFAKIADLFPQPAKKRSCDRIRVKRVPLLVEGVIDRLLTALSPDKLPPFERVIRKSTPAIPSAVFAALEAGSPTGAVRALNLPECRLMEVYHSTSGDRANAIVEHVKAMFDEDADTPFQNLFNLFVKFFCALALIMACGSPSSNCFKTDEVVQGMLNSLYNLACKGQLKTTARAVEAWFAKYDMPPIGSKRARTPATFDSDDNARRSKRHQGLKY
ncbi:uncharacterized protein AMSG_07588 [Thecamonas trahens ATCC 50062]|uniref:Uncharacterized protein n=1 Tax=Thecamonas trahens ATCC 50062 TaxID=461836 RepID=A0A0L0DJ99_THETB|nr:hypothetical protein AMSG_07588 [Thecamonas trahens ATCC 50062]KNC51403.1 hypothetical protein AMSG_07588 [Thecamonas trahens ATCC 50062]|eukprot:XP_013756070.1 hypothetical protein AMSG_07588 [Thecamonas trahens ATCC 50062]